MDDTRSRMVAAGARLLRTQGYHATHLVQLTEGGTLPRGSLYHHFRGGKDEMALEAIAFAAREVDADLEAAADGAVTPSQALGRYVRLLADRLETSGFKEGCWYAATALDVAPDNVAISEALAREFARWTNRFAQTLPFEPDQAQQAATAVIAMIEGGLMLARVRRDADTLRDLIPTLQTLVTPRGD